MRSKRIRARQADAGYAFDRLLDDLRDAVLLNLRCFPRIGRPYLSDPPQSVEALAQLAALPIGAPQAPREYLHGDYLLLYITNDESETVYLLSIRHHRELGFGFGQLRPGA